MTAIIWIANGTAPIANNGGMMARTAMRAAKTAMRARSVAWKRRDAATINLLENVAMTHVRSDSVLDQTCQSAPPRGAPSIIASS